MSNWFGVYLRRVLLVMLPVYLFAVVCLVAHQSSFSIYSPEYQQVNDIVFYLTGGLLGFIGINVIGLILSGR